MEQILLDSIYLDEIGYKEYISKTESLEKELDLVNAQISEIILKGQKEAVNSDFERLKLAKKNLQETIETRRRDVHRIVIVEREENSNLLDIGDVVKVKMVFPNGEEAEDTFELVAGENDFSGDIPKISINKPLGKCVYRKNVGETDSYDIKDGKVMVTSLEKVKVNSLKKTY